MIVEQWLRQRYFPFYWQPWHEETPYIHYADGNITELRVLRDGTRNLAITSKRTKELTLQYFHYPSKQSKS